MVELYCEVTIGYNPRYKLENDDPTDDAYYQELKNDPDAGMLSHGPWCHYHAPLHTFL